MTTLINAKEVCNALREMISEETTCQSPAILSGDRETVFRQVFTFYYPGFQDKLRKATPDLTRAEELVCMLTALQETPEDIVNWTNLSEERLSTVCQSICDKMRLESKQLLCEHLYSMLG